MNHPNASKDFLEDQAYAKWHDETLYEVRKKRDLAMSKVDEWEELRVLASQIKDHVINNLDKYLIQFEKNAIANDIKVHWARDAKQHNEIVHNIIAESGAQNIIKSKSILTEECGLNHYLERCGYEVTDSDLGERIIQFAKQPPSHIVAPAVHLKTEQISSIFHEHLQTEEGNTDPQYLTNAARVHLRQRFLKSQVAITGVNFGIAETGGFVVCTNEGNADLGVHIAKVHIACMGIEKLIPNWEHLGVMTRLLARSATGQPITNYTSHFLKPRKGQQMHIVLVDNNRTTILAKENFRNSLKCIRCGACMNTCPVYRRSGGHSYGATLMGPIGSVLSPQHDLKKHKDLPFASSLCGSCSDVCPVKINIHDMLFHARQEITFQKEDNLSKRWMMTMISIVLSSPKLYSGMGKIIRKVLKGLPGFIINSKFNIWARSRKLPEVPEMSFKEWYQKRKPNGQ